MKTVSKSNKPLSHTDVKECCVFLHYSAFYVLNFPIAECTFIILEKSVFENTGDEIGKLFSGLFSDVSI
jgi:hypothetical protein